VTRCLSIALVLCALPALADPTDPEARSRFYGEARGWQIEALDDAMGFVGCRGMIPLQAAGPLLVERGSEGAEGWMLYVPSAQVPGAKDGDSAEGRFIVDGTEAGARFRLLGHGWAGLELSAGMRQQMQDGNLMTTALDGEEPRQWILNGSTAALGMIEECHARQGAVWR